MENEFDSHRRNKWVPLRKENKDYKSRKATESYRFDYLRLDSEKVKELLEELSKRNIGI